MEKRKRKKKAYGLLQLMEYKVENFEWNKGF